MPARPHDADDEPREEPREELLDARKDEPGEQPHGTPPHDDLDDRPDADGTAPGPDERWDERWEDLVAQLTPADPRGWSPDPDPEEDDRFVPPDPGPVLGGDPLLTMAWTAVVGAPAVLLLALLLGGVPPLLAQVAGAAFVAGVAVLVWRMPRDRSDDDGPGAVV